uniref:Mitochondrial sodium/hydrogen exchanger 9B2-like n=1 Tax=Saccoglossus kowalevskii TaxID=10224 RepID=A0ABM0N0M4_SACKO|nr:PREDICTED: mitochondrial sodium/hydrogen exchanger 9B2-like [Saccoglossus kowalevskii]
MLVSFLSVFRAGLNLKEKCFIPLAWLPKATVQAAIGSIALDTAREKGSSEEVIELGKQILTIAVLSIIITAPLGAAAIALSGPRLLNKTTSTSHKLVNQDVPSECASMLNKDTGV